MCAITGSLHKNKLKELYMLNAYRGELNDAVLLESNFDNIRTP